MISKPRLIKARANHYYGKKGYYATFMFDDSSMGYLQTRLLRVLNQNFGKPNTFSDEVSDRRWGTRTTDYSNRYLGSQRQISIRSAEDLTLLMLLLSGEGLLEKFDVLIK